MHNSLIKVIFPVSGQKLPADHSYFLYSSISNLIPSSHNLPDDEKWLGIEMISGNPFDKGVILLPTRGAKLNLRIPADKFGEVLPLAGRRLDLGGHVIRLGIPTARPLMPSPILYSRIVTFRLEDRLMQPDAKDEILPAFLEIAKRHLAEMNVTADIEIPNEAVSRHRRIITIKGKKIVGFSLIAKNLNDEDSLKLQSIGLGGRRSMGCGIFNPVRKPYDYEVEGNG
ncbi:MAG: type I-MYXAN CRISPR-associated protein Cas6/Cmx6 [Acidobacteria bacterium]|nr:type I-MYXAN CRISPR-associated protein Cas6/Cmx6 [Acidobacteriota bacterium]